MRGRRPLPDRGATAPGTGPARGPHGRGYLRMESRWPANHPHRPAYRPTHVVAEIEHPRSIRSFVMRGGRITEAQQRALELLWPRYGIEFTPAPLDLDTAF